MIMPILHPHFIQGRLYRSRVRNVISQSFIGRPSRFAARSTATAGNAPGRAFLHAETNTYHVPSLFVTKSIIIILPGLG